MLGACRAWLSLPTLMSIAQAIFSLEHGWQTHMADRQTDEVTDASNHSTHASATAVVAEDMRTSTGKVSVFVRVRVVCSVWSALQTLHECWSWQVRQRQMWRSLCVCLQLGNLPRWATSSHTSLSCRRWFLLSKCGMGTCLLIHPHYCQVACSDKQVEHEP